MRAVVQRVSRAEVEADGAIVGGIQRGLVVFLGVQSGDTEADAAYIAAKITGLRVFDDVNDMPNLSVADVQGAVLLVSQFTLCADARHGRRPSYIQAARPEQAIALYELTVQTLKKSVPVETGKFQAMMRVRLENDGPHTILLDSRRLF